MAKIKLHFSITNNQFGLFFMVAANQFRYFCKSNWLIINQTINNMFGSYEQYIKRCNNKHNNNMKTHAISFLLLISLAFCSSCKTKQQDNQAYTYRVKVGPVQNATKHEITEFSGVVKEAKAATLNDRFTALASFTTPENSVISCFSGHGGRFWRSGDGRF